MSSLNLRRWDEADRLDAMQTAARCADVDCRPFQDRDVLKLIIGDESEPNSWLSSDTWEDLGEWR